MTNLAIVSLVKMEYGLKMMVKSHIEEIFLKFFHVLAISYEMNLPLRKEEF